MVDRSRGFRRWRIAARLAGATLLLITAACGRDRAVDTGETPIPCGITGVSTGARTTWAIGIDPPAQVRWQHTGSAAAVRLDLLKDGLPVAVITDSTANDGYYQWIPGLHGQAGGGGFGLRVSALAEAGCAGEITGLTLLDYGACQLAWTVDLPENVLAGYGFGLDLTWTSGSASGIVDLELWQDDLGGPAEFVGTIATATPDDGFFRWDPVDSFNYGSNDWFTVRISDPLLPDCAAFTGTFRMQDDTVCACAVYGFPAGAVLQEGQAIDLYPDQQNGSRRVELRLYAGAIPVPGGLIAADVPVGQAVRWVVDDYDYAGTNRSAFRIRSTDVLDSYCVGISDRFTIQ